MIRLNTFFKTFGALGLALAPVGRACAFFQVDDLYYSSPDSAGRVMVIGCQAEAEVVSIPGTVVYEPATGSKATPRSCTVTSIRSDAFIGRSELTRVSIPASVTSIGPAAFAGCGKLTVITVADDNTSYKAVSGMVLTKDGLTLVAAPGGATELTIPDGVVSIGMAAFRNCWNLERVTLPDSVVRIGAAAFDGCSGLTTLTFPASVEEVGAGAFYGCQGLTAFHVASGNSAYQSIDGMLCDGTGTKVVAVPGSVTRVTVPDGVTIIGTIAFGGCPMLTEVSIPPSVTNIEELAFVDCTSLTCVTLSSETGSLVVGKEAFDAQTTVTVDSREGYVFSGWTNADGQVVADPFHSAYAETVAPRWVPEGEVLPPVPPVPGVQTIGTMDTSFARSQTVVSALYDDAGTLVGVVQVKAGKKNRSGAVKLSASATLTSGQKVTARALTLMPADDGTARGTLLFKSPLGEMAFELAQDGTFTLENDHYTVRAAIVGGDLLGDGSKGVFSLDRSFALDLTGELLDALLPFEESFDVAGGKWKFAKGATVKVAKDSTTQGYRLVVDDTKGKTNLSSLKLTYTARTGLFKGSFKAYATETANGRMKLKKYTVNVSGFVVDGKGVGQATCKKPVGGPWAVRVESSES